MRLSILDGRHNHLGAPSKASPRRPLALTDRTEPLHRTWQSSRPRAIALTAALVALTTSSTASSSITANMQSMGGLGEALEGDYDISDAQDSGGDKRGGKSDAHMSNTFCACIAATNPQRAPPAATLSPSKYY